MKQNLYRITATILFLCGTLVHAQSSYDYAVEEEDDYQSYDSIVNELNQTRTKKPRTVEADPFANVEIHTGVGFVASMMSISPEGGNQEFQTLLQGFQFQLGIDLFSKKWAAEGSIRSFGQDKVSTNSGDSKDQARVSLKEFDLKIIYKPYVGTKIKLRTGLGLAARYMDIKYELNDKSVKRDYTTPSSVLFMGADTFLTDTLSLGAEFSLRSSMIEETIDDTAVDATLLVGAHF